MAKRKAKGNVEKPTRMLKARAPHAGQPPAFGSKEELEGAIQVYFDSLRMFEMPSKAGLLLHLDISRETYSQYKKKYPDAIRRANSAIETAWVQKLAGQSSTGSIFYLKNAFKETYQDKHETDLRVKEMPKPILGGIAKKKNG